uniref:Uncharacterized protein n=1 Tax=Arundo donax TaxID=35708 RepID=A0A0A9BUE1_ARUDO
MVWKPEAGFQSGPCPPRPQAKAATGEKLTSPLQLQGNLSSLLQSN